MNAEIDIPSILRSDPVVEALHWALCNEIHPATELEVKLVWHLAYHLGGLQHVPVINRAMFRWLLYLGYPYHQMLPRTAEVADREFYLFSQSDFLLGEFGDPDEKGISMARVFMKPAIEVVFSRGLTETLSPDEAVHARKYVFLARRLRLLILIRFSEV